MNKGFTLVELLAVILILGIISLIAIPTITNIIDDAKIGAEKTTAIQMAASAESYNELCNLKDDETCVKDFTTLTDSTLKNTLNLKGTIPSIADITTFEIVNDKVNLTYTKNGITCTIANSSVATCTK